MAPVKQASVLHAKRSTGRRVAIPGTVQVLPTRGSSPGITRQPAKAASMMKREPQSLCYQARGDRLAEPSRGGIEAAESAPEPEARRASR